MELHDKEKWKVAVKEEYEYMMKHDVFQEVPRDEVPEGAKILTSTWDKKKKSNWTFRAIMNTRGFQQIDGEYHDSTSISSPIANKVTLRCMFVLTLMACWMGELLDVKGAFLHGDFESGEMLYIDVPQGFAVYVVLLLLKTLYGLKQASMAFWREFLKAFRSMVFDQSKVGPCLYFKWTQHGLLV
jgi:hypothetical protein